METGRDRIDRLARALAAAPSRRQLTRWLAAATLAAGLTGVAAGADPASGAKKENAKQPKTCKPKCPTCQRCRRGTCKPAADGRRCGAGRTCEGGACVRPPLPLACDKGGPCRVFVTSLAAAGSSFGGLNGADQGCADLAAAAGLTGTYRAWLAAGGDSPATRFTNREAAGPYRLVGNAADRRNPPPTVADSFADLIACDGAAGACLKHPIDRFETGVAIVGSATVWTGARPDGTTGSDTCGGWTGAQSGDLVGVMGSTTDVSGGWTEKLTVDCNTAAALYCFEQA
jgi:hypothetical protein